MPPVIFHFLNDLSSVKPVKQSKNINEAKRVLIEAVTQISTRRWSQGYSAFTCFTSHYFFSGFFSSSYVKLNTCSYVNEIRQALGNYRQQLNDVQQRIHLKSNISTFMRGFIRSIDLLFGQPSSLEKIPKADEQLIKLPAKDSEACQQDSGIPVKFRPCSNIPANIRTDIRNTMKKAGYHPDDEGICYGVAWAALLACVRQDGQAYMQRMQYLVQMEAPPLPGVGDTHQVYPFFDAVTLSMTSYKNMRGYEKGIGYPGRQEVAFSGRVIGGHEPDYQVPVVKQTFIAECTPERFIRFLQQTRENNNGIPFGVMIHYPGHATSTGFDGSKWLATDHDSHYYTNTTERLYSFFDEQSGHYKDGRIIAAMEVVTGNQHALNITHNTLVVNAKKSVSTPQALHLALQYGDVEVTTDCIAVIGQQAHTPEILLKQLTCKDARGTPGLYMALQRGHADAITAFMQASTTVISALPLPEAQKAESLYSLFSSRNTCLHTNAQSPVQENTGDKDASRKRPPPDQAGAEKKRSKPDAQTRPQETIDNSIQPGKRPPPNRKDAKAKRSKHSAEKGKQGNNLQASNAMQGSRMENAEPEAQQAIEVATGLGALQGYLKFRMNDRESEAAKKLFQILSNKKIRIKDTFYKLLANNVERKDLPSFCAKASTFFEALADTIKDTGCLTSMLGRIKRYSQSFMAREDAELEYLAGLDTFRCFSSMNNNRGLPKKEAVKEMLDWHVWKPQGVFSMELFRAFSSMNNKQGLPQKEAVEAVLNWELWKQDGVFSMELFRAFSSINNGKGLPKKKAVEAVLAWDVWKLGGVFSMELFRAFSSMNCGKGLPKKEEVEAVLDWEIWKPEGMFSMELFRAFSSMNNKQGLPQKEAVEAVLAWEVWKPEGMFSMELFRAFSSMNHGKGLPKKEEVEALLDWELWKLDGVFSMELFRAFSSMNCGKGLPKKKAAEAVLAWDVWKLDGVFGMELFRAFSSMNSGKGLPKKKAVEAVLAWDVWKPEGLFSMELFRAFSSMNSSKGLPKKEEVEAVLGWELWKQEGVFSMELFRAFSSMNHGKGLPKKEEVEAVLGWELWKQEGVFSMELFRAFSSMSSGKGLPKKEEVEAVLNWEVWKPEGVFGMELFRAFSSMNCGKGLPTKEAVEAVLAWELWKPEGVFSMKLFRAFSSMNSGKGLPKKKEVEAVLAWEVWKPEGMFSMELFRAFSSMNNGKGLPKKEEVEAVLNWEVWKPEGVFGMELFRAFSSMNCGKGLPTKEAVEAVLNWELWKLEGVFSMELFRAFSAMNSGKGLPKKEAVEAVLDWELWKPEGVFSMELFRAFSSMNHGKGLPTKEAVEAVLNWELWKPEGVFSMELFRAFSSMNHGKGLPKKEEVEAVLDWELWKPEGVFSMELFRAFSSMNCGKGLPTKEAVEAVLAWELWKPEGMFSMELFRAFSSMNNKQGLPQKEAVEAVLDWELWKPGGVFSMKLFRAFSSMNNSKGLPKKEAVEEMLGCLGDGKESDGSLFKLAVRLYASEGIPDIKKLKQYEQKLLNLFFADIAEPDSDDEDSNEYEHRRLIQPAALFLLTRKPHYVLNFMDVECFYQQAAGAPALKLENLLKLLLSYGGQGVARYLTLNDNDREALLNLSSLRTPLPLTLQAITDFSPEERRLYLFFTRNLKAPPDKDQWIHISLQLNKLASVLRNHNNQRRYLEVIWNLAPSDRDTFLSVNHAEYVIAVFPSLSALEKLAKSYSQQTLKALLKACLQFKQGNPSKEDIKRLFAALLETGLPLYGHRDIPDHFLSGYIAAGDSATFIPIKPSTETTGKLALHFVASVTKVLSDMFYDYESGRLKIEQYGGGIHPFPIPGLEIQDKGIKISNWSVDVFRHFLTVTEFPEQYYLSQEQWQKRCTPAVPLYIERRREACRQREGSEPDSTSFKPLSITALMGLLKSNIPLKPAVWKSFNYHKDKLPRAVHRRLLDEIEKSTCEDIPASLTGYLKDRHAAEALQDEVLPQSRLNMPTSLSPVTAGETLNEEEQFQGLWVELSRKTLLENADIQLLANYKEYMTIEQIVNVLKRAPAVIAPCKLNSLRRLLIEKRDLLSGKDPLFLTLNDGEIASYLMEAEI